MNCSRNSNRRSVLLFLFSLLLSFILPCLAFAQTVEETAFDVFLGREYKGVLAARYSTEFKSTWIEISTPADILNLLPKLKDPDALVKLLSGRIDKEVSDDSVGTITVSPKSFSISIVLKPEALLEASLAVETTNLTDQTRSFRQDLTGSLIEGTQRATAIASVSSLNFSGNWLYSNFAFFSEGRSNLQEISGSTLFGRYKVSGGGLRSPGFQLQPSLDVYGVGVSSVTELLPLDKTLRANKLQIFVPIPGRVEFFRSGTLIDSQLLGYGLQEVDTSKFPDGGYYLDIVIPNGAGGLRERRYFSRSGFLAPRGYPYVYASVGALRDQFSLLDTQVAISHLEWRVLDFLQLEGGGYTFNEQTAGILGFRGVLGDTVFGSSIAFPSGQDIGYSFILAGSLYGVSFGGNYEKSSFLDLPNEDSFDIPNPILVPINQAGQQERLLRAGENYNFTVSYRLDDFEFMYETYATKDDLLTNFYYRGPGVRWQIYQDDRRSLNLQIARYDTQNGTRDYGFMTFVYRFGNWQEQLQATYFKDDSRRDRVLSNFLNYDSRQQRSGLGTRAQLRTQLRSELDVTTDNSSIDITHGFRPLSTTVYAQQNGGFESATSSEPTIAGTVGSSFTLSDKGDVSLSPPDLGMSLVVIHFSEVEDDVEMEVLINESVAGTVKGGGRLVLGITPYVVHKIRVRPTENSSLVNYETSVRKIFLNPGAVSHLRFGIERHVIVLGKVIDGSGQPIRFKRILGGKETPLTDSEGQFQLELKGDERLSVELPSGNCELKYPDLSQVEYFIEVEPIVCEVSKQTAE